MQYGGIEKDLLRKDKRSSKDKNVVFETREFLIHIITQYICIFNIYIKDKEYYIIEDYGEPGDSVENEPTLRNNIFPKSGCSTC